MMWSCIFDHGEARPIHESPKLIVISVDGFRFDFLQRFSNQDIILGISLNMVHL